MSQAKRALIVVMLTVVLDLIGFGILIPIQPFLALSFGARPGVVTLLSASFSIMQFFFMPMWGALSDRVGRRPIMLLSIAVSTLGYLLFALADSLTWLFIARMIAGCGTANIGIAQAIIADNTEGSERARGMGLLGAAFGIGFMIGPAIGGIFSQYSLQTPSFIAAGLSLLNLALAWVLLGESRPPQKAVGQPKRMELRPFAAFSALKNANVHQNVPRLLLLSFVFTLGFSLFEQSLGLFIGATWSSQNLTHGVALTSYFLMTVGFTAAFVQGGLTGRLVKMAGEYRLLRLGFGGFSIALFAFPLIGQLQIFPLFLALGLCSATCTGIALPSLNGLLSRLTREDEQGAVLGLGQSSSALGRSIGPLFSGTLFEISHLAPFWTASLVMLIGVGVIASLSARSAATEVNA